ncbi:MAG: DNA modification methylase [Verrucomicrobia bacterium]|nr:DNA modification methylase [Verrucomicrobiota bacterium]
MFPLTFPLGILSRRARKGDNVLDPFCGRGTTNFAARLVGLDSLGVDSSPVAVAITASKLVKTTVNDILVEAIKILAQYKASYIPQGDFWQAAFHPNVLDSLCRFREAFLKDCSTAARIGLRGILLGALHGPKQKCTNSYFSNQCPRTYAPKPAYAIRYWRDRGLIPDQIDVLDLIERRAKRYYQALYKVTGNVHLADSREANALKLNSKVTGFNWVITSPPYYGMSTYIADQWLRNWYVGGPDAVDYTNRNQLIHSSPKSFVDDLRKVWCNAASVCVDDANMVIRFGGISNRNVAPLDLIKGSLVDSGWRITTIREAGTADEGRRQADTFLRTNSKPLVEYDVYAVKC